MRILPQMFQGFLNRNIEILGTKIIETLSDCDSYNQEASTQSSISGVSDGIRIVPSTNWASSPPTAGYVAYGRYYKCSRSRYVSAKNTTSSLACT